MYVNICIIKQNQRGGIKGVVQKDLGQIYQRYRHNGMYMYVDKNELDSIMYVSVSDSVAMRN
jgi:uncharacterized protein YcgL (UPF0745 family)